jgi:DNA ligase-1
MKFSALCDYFARLETTRSRLALTDIVTDLFKHAGKDLYNVVLYARGWPFPTYSSLELGIAERMMLKCIATATGASEATVEKEIAKTGDAGLAAERLFSKKSQTTLGRKELDVERLAESFGKLAAMQGPGMVDRKVKHVVELLNSCGPREAKYVVKLMLGEMRSGVGEGIVRDAIAKAFGVPAELVEKANSLVNDYGDVAVTARDKGAKGLEKVEIRLGRPLRPMLAQTVETVEEAFKEFKPASFQYKYDGFRAVIEVHEGRVDVFSRRLENVTHQFPDIVKMVRAGIHAKNCIVEGEAVAWRGRPVPFQELSRRIKRKYDIEEMVKALPVKLFLFDCLFLNGKNMIPEPYKKRWAALESIVKQGGGLSLADSLVTDDAGKANAFFKKALAEGHEGLMIKNLDAEYKPGSRVGYMYKWKPTTETLDLVVVGADWGEGRRAKWLGSYLLACRDPATGEFLEIGRMATGMTDAQMEEITVELKKNVMSEKGKSVAVRPSLVMEVGYQEIQKSPTYASGYALRFPRLVRIRPDRRPDECDTLERVDSLYERFRRGAKKPEK